MTDETVIRTSKNDLPKASRDLAILAIQSMRYSRDDEFRQAVDDVLSITDPRHAVETPEHYPVAAHIMCTCGKRFGEHPIQPPWWPCMVRGELKASNPKHERRVVGHASGWQEQLSTCACGKPWPCPEVDQTATIERLAAERDEWKKAFQQEVARLQTDIQELTCGDPRLVSSSSETRVGVSFDEHERYKRCLYRANGRLIQMGQEPEKLDYPERPELKAFVQLCAPHGQDWLTCPECAKAAVKGNPQV